MKRRLTGAEERQLLEIVCRIDELIAQLKAVRQERDELIAELLADNASPSDIAFVIGTSEKLIHLVRRRQARRATTALASLP